MSLYLCRFFFSAKYFIDHFHYPFNFLNDHNFNSLSYNYLTLFSAFQKLSHYTLHTTQIVFESERFGHEDASLAVDDIVMIQGSCEKKHVPLIPHIAPAATTKSPETSTRQLPDPGHGSAADDLFKLGTCVAKVWWVGRRENVAWVRKVW